MHGSQPFHGQSPAELAESWQQEGWRNNHDHCTISDQRNLHDHDVNMGGWVLNIVVLGTWDHTGIDGVHLENLSKSF